MRPGHARFEAHRTAAAARLRQAAAEGRIQRAGPGSISWTINRERVVVAGWPAAILLQLAHPLVAQAVAEHSSFRGHPFAGVQRLHATVRAMLLLTFGDEPQAIAAAAGINVIHDRVAGQLAAAAGGYAAGAPYSAHEPELLRWVHATLLDVLPRTYERLVGPLPAGARDAYCREALAMEPLLGMPAGFLPGTEGALRQYLDEMLASGRIEVTPVARTLARAVLHPPLGGLMWPALRPIRLLTTGTLPAAVREAYGLRWRPRDARALRRWTAAARTLGRAAPRALTEWRLARRAARRERRARSRA